MRLSHLSLAGFFLALLVAAPSPAQAKDRLYAFDASVRQARFNQGRTILLLQGVIEGYGETMVSTSIEGKLRNTGGEVVPPAEVTPGTRVRVEHGGRFMESMPLQVRARAITVLSEKARPEEKGFIVMLDDPESNAVYVAGTADGKPDLRVRLGEAPLFNQEKEKISFADLQVGQEIRIQFDGRYLESIPMQINALRVEVTVRKKPVFTEVGYIVGGDDTMLWIAKEAGGQASAILRISPDMQVELPDGSQKEISYLRLGDQVEAEYDGMVLESFPVQITPSKLRLK